MSGAVVSWSGWVRRWRTGSGQSANASLRSGMEELISFPRTGSAPNQRRHEMHKRLQLESAMPEGPAPRWVQEDCSSSGMYIGEMVRSGGISRPCRQASAPRATASPLATASNSMREIGPHATGPCPLLDTVANRTSCGTRICRCSRLMSAALAR